MYFGTDEDLIIIGFAIRLLKSIGDIIIHCYDFIFVLCYIPM
jgi:hypothetical protein